jgi:hypothetical protein
MPALSPQRQARRHKRRRDRRCRPQCRCPKRWAGTEYGLRTVERANRATWPDTSACDRRHGEGDCHDTNEQADTDCDPQPLFALGPGCARWQSRRVEIAAGLGSQRGIWHRHDFRYETGSLARTRIGLAEFVIIRSDFRIARLSWLKRLANQNQRGVAGQGLHHES